MHQKKQTKPISILEDLNRNQQTYFEFNTDEELPPYSTTICKITEINNSSPNLIRSSMYKIPSNKNMFNQIRMPIGLVITPFLEENIQEEENPIYCSDCFSFINKFTVIDDYRKTFKCNICNKTNSFDEIKYEIKPTMCFKLKESKKMYQSDFVDENFHKNSSVKENNLIICLEKNERPFFEKSLIFLEQIFENVKLFDNLTLILYDQKIEIITLNKQNEISVKKIQMGEGERIFLPKSYSIRNIDKKNKIMDFLKELKIEERNIKSESMENVFNAIYEVSRNYAASKTLLFKNISKKVLEKEKYDDFIEKFINENNSLNLITRKEPESFLSRFVCETNGLYFNINNYAALIENLKEEYFYDIKIDVKCSNKLNKSRVYANTQVMAGISTFISQMSEKNSFAVTFSSPENMRHNESNYAQIQISYSDRKFNRCIKLLNIELKGSDNLLDIYNSIMFDSLFFIFGRYLIDDIKGIDHKIKTINIMLIETLKVYRRANGKPIGTLLIPANMKSLLVLLNVFLKNDKFQKKEFYALREIFSNSCEDMINSLYPKLISFSDFYLSYEENINEITYKNLKFENIENGELYLLDDGKEILIYAHNIDESLKEVLFDENYEIKETEEGKVLEILLEKLNKKNYKEIKIVEKEMDFLGKLYEDKKSNVMAFEDYLKFLHLSVEKK